MTWANQVRVLKQQFQALGAVIGQGLIQALKPALIAMNAFLSRVIEFAKKVLNALGKIFGWKVDISASGLDTGLDGAEEAATGLGDALGGAGDAAKGASDNVKELNKQLQSFDKLNVLTTSDTGGSGGSGGGGGGSGSGGGGGAGAGSGGDVTASIEKTEGLFKSNIDDLFELGQYIRNTLMNAMDSIDWDSIYEKARGFGKGLAEFLNGLFSGTAGYNLFASLGKTIAGAINTALNFFDSFAEEFDFSTFGTNLASFFVETVKNIDWTLAGKAFHEWMQGIKKAINAFVAYLWKNKKEVWKAFTDFFSEATIEDVAIAIGLITITKIGKWALGYGVLKLAGEAIGLLFKGIGIKVVANILGVTFKEVAELGLAKGIGLVAQGIAESLGIAGAAGSIAAGVCTVAIPIAIVAGLTYLSWDTDKTIEHNQKDAQEAIDKLRKSGMSDDEIAKNAPDLWSKYQNAQTIYDKVFGKDAGYYQGGGYGNAQAEKFYANFGIEVTDGGVTTPWDGKGFWTWLAEKMFPKSVEVNGKNVDINYFGGVGFGLGDGEINFPWKGKGFFKWLAEKLFPKSVEVNGEDVEINYGGGVGFGLGDDGINFPWKGKGFWRWLGEKLFPKTVSVNGDDVEINYGGGVGFGLGDGKKFEFPWKGKGFFKWLFEKLFPKTVKTTDGQNLEISYSVGLDFGLDDKFGNGKFKTWLEKKLGISKNKDTVTATTGLAKGRTWDSGKKEYNSVHDETATKTVAGKKNTTYTSTKTDYYGFKSDTATKTAKGSIHSTYTSTKNDYNGFKSNDAWKSIKGYTYDSYTKTKKEYNSFPYETFAWKSLKGYTYDSFWTMRSNWKGVYDKTITIGLKGVMSSMGSGVKSFVTALANVIKNNAMGGILTAAGWQPIQGYATGGMPSSAEVFMARENGLPEMVGRIGSHTAVMNNDQIVSSVAAGVASAVSSQNEILLQQNALLRQLLAKETGITSSDIFDAVRSENRNYTNRTGKSAFSF